MKKYLDINDLSSYRRAFDLSNSAWNIILKWDYLAKQTLGIQFIRAVDSISANIAEGFGRYGKKDKIKFYYYSFGSLKECQDWLEKARVRNLLSDQEYANLSNELQDLPREIHQLIKFTEEKLQE